MENKSNIVVRQEIENRIYSIRGLQVMLDSHLADFYEVKPIRLREQVKRNSSRFPEDFMFQLNELEVEFMVSQNAIPSKQYLGGYLPYVFTEQGVAAISAILKSDKAVQISIQIARAFVEMRKLLLNNAGLLQRVEKIETKLIENDANFERVFNALETKNSKPTQNIFFDGQIYDAYSFIVELIEKAEKDIVLIDNYVDNTVLDMFSKKKNAVEVRIITHSKSKLLETDVQKFNQQYPKLGIEYSDKMHDRFLLIDNTELYHIGASIKDMGKKCIAFSLINDKIIITNLLRNL